MTLLRLATLTATAFLVIGSTTAIANETYGRASFYEDGVGVSYVAFSVDGGRIAFATKGRARCASARPVPARR